MRARSCVLLLVAACGGGDGKGGPKGTGATTQMEIGPNGGTITLEGATLAVLPGALTSSVTIEITSTTEEPAGLDTWYSPVYRFGPDGTTFAIPALVTLEFAGSPSMPAVAWSSAGDAFSLIDGSHTATAVTAGVSHFSAGVVANRKGSVTPDGATTDVPAVQSIEQYGTTYDSFQMIVSLEQASSPSEAMTLATDVDGDGTLENQLGAVAANLPAPCSVMLGASGIIENSPGFAFQFEPSGGATRLRVYQDVDGAPSTWIPKLDATSATSTWHGGSATVRFPFLSVSSTPPPISIYVSMTVAGLTVSRPGSDGLTLLIGGVISAADVQNVLIPREWECVRQSANAVALYDMNNDAMVSLAEYQNSSLTQATHASDASVGGTSGMSFAIRSRNTATTW